MCETEPFFPCVQEHMDYVEEVALEAAGFTSPPDEQAAAADGDKKPAATDRDTKPAASEDEAATDRDTKPAASEDEAEDDAPDCGDKKPAAVSANVAEDDAAMCVVCLVERKDFIFIPCFHVCACEGCAAEIQNTKNPTCPMCRAPFTSVNKVYF
jgi:hypothetical protein